MDLIGLSHESVGSGPREYGIDGQAEIHPHDCAIAFDRSGRHQRARDDPLQICLLPELDELAMSNMMM